MLQLWFDSNSQELLRSVFQFSPDSAPCVCVRGRERGVYRDATGTFQWTLALHALAILLVRTKQFCVEKRPIHEAQMEGGSNSPAASLDYAISKQPRWLLDLFGTDKDGRSHIRRFLHRTNSERRLSGNVHIAWNSQCFDPMRIEVYLDEQLLTSPENLATLATELERQWTDNRRQTATRSGVSVDRQPGTARGGLEGEKNHTLNQRSRNYDPQQACKMLKQLPPCSHTNRMGEFQETLSKRESLLIVLEDDAAGLQLMGHVPSILDCTNENLNWLVEATRQSKIGFVTLPSRSSSPAVAERLFAESARKLYQVIKQLRIPVSWATRFDSCLRGHNRLEMNAIKRVLHDHGEPCFDLEVYAPSYFQQGRATVLGCQLIVKDGEGEPISNTEYSRVPGFEYNSSLVSDLVSDEFDRFSRRIFSLDCISLRTKPLEELIARLGSLPLGTKVVVDIVDEHDSLAAAYILYMLESKGKRILCRAAPSLLLGMLGRSVAAIPTINDLSKELPAEGRRGLIVAGSLSSLTKAQLRTLSERGDIALVPFETAHISDSRLSTVKRISQRCSALMQSGFIPLVTTRLWEDTAQFPTQEERNLVLDSLGEIVSDLEEIPSWLLIKGSDTCLSVLRWGAKADRMMSFGQFGEGGTISKIESTTSEWRGKHVVLYPGNVGTSDSIASIVESLVGHGNSASTTLRDTTAPPI
ncbi:MAG: hypothetical protein DCC75_08165 [Proteobacteria bacterium]|nr:MAG: hypothetical protein DCC75_08165 [Pseudomonadota bacterium]